MKILKIILLFSVVMFFGCDSDDPKPSDVNSINASEVIGTWTVDLYRDGNENETSSFDDITFIFEETGDFLIQRNATDLVDGSWTLNNDGSRLNISVPQLSNENESFGEDLYEIHDNWRVNLIRITELHLTDEDEVFELSKVN